MSRSPEAIVSRRRELDTPADAATRGSYRLDVRLEEHARNAQWLIARSFLKPPTPDAIAVDADTRADPAALARLARRVVGVPSGPLGPLASVLERLGLYLTVVEESAEGASLLLDGYGVAVISGDAAPGRRRWTAVHELGHHLLQDEYHSDAGVAASRDDREQCIDRFVEEFLLPEPDVRRFWQESQDAGRVPRAALIALAAEYRVSWSAAVLRARRLELIESSTARSLKADRPVRGDFLAICGAEPEPDLAVGATGAHWRQAVLAAWTTGAITASRTVELLYGTLQEDELPQQELEDTFA
jgi:Zn-dependent peptidase ImmA (M78 family)